MWPGAIYPTQRKYPLWIIPFGSDSFGHSLGLLLSPCLVFFYFSFLHINQLKSDSQNHHMVDNNWHAHLTLEKEVDKSCHSLTKSSPLWTVTGRIYSLVLFLCTRSEMIAIFFLKKMAAIVNCPVYNLNVGPFYVRAVTPMSNLLLVFITCNSYCGVCSWGWAFQLTIWTYPDTLPLTVLLYVDGIVPGNSCLIILL